MRLALENGISVQTGSGSLSNNMSPAEPWINSTLAVRKARTNKLWVTQGLCNASLCGSWEDNSDVLTTLGTFSPKNAQEIAFAGRN